MIKIVGKEIRSRYVRAMIPGTGGVEIEIDRETGEVEYHHPLGQWEQLKTYEWEDI